MNWARTNKLLAGFLVFLAIGVVVLGYLLFTAYGSFATVSKAYEDKARELNRLQALKPFPDAENLEKEVAAKEAFAERITELQTKLNEQELPLIPLTPEEFQDKLRQSVSKVAARAGEQGVQLPEGFYLGFEEYRDRLPIGKAAGPLGRQLDAIQSVVAILLDNRVDQIGAVERRPLPEEDRSAKPAEGDGEELVKRNPFTITMVSGPSAFRRVINTKVSAQQFYILRLMTVQNEELTGPVRGIPEAAAPPSPPDGPEGAAAGGAGTQGAEAKRIELLLGDEKLTASFEIEIVDFAAVKPENEPAAE
jgi:hypothetical protein